MAFGWLKLKLLGRRGSYFICYDGDDEEEEDATYLRC